MFHVIQRVQRSLGPSWTSGRTEIQAEINLNIQSTLGRFTENDISVVTMRGLYLPFLIQGVSV